MNKKQKQIYQGMVDYYERSQEVMTKQAEELKNRRTEQGRFTEKIAQFVDKCVDQGHVPSHLAEILKIDLSRHPSKFVDMMLKSGSVMALSGNQQDDSLGSPSDIPEAKSDLFTTWVMDGR